MINNYGCLLLNTCVFLRFGFTLIFLVSIVNAQWQKQPVETNASLRGLSIVSKKILWASGTSGTFLRTIDGGKTWKVGQVPDAEKLDFRDVEAFDANIAYLLSIGNGETSRVYKTIDGGETWKLQFKNTNEKVFLDAFAFWDEQHGIAMGDPVDGHFYLMATDDGGNSWKSIETSKMPATKAGEAAFAASGTCLLAQGKSDVFLVSGGNAARVFRSTDRGLTWIASETPIINGTSGSGIFSIAISDAKTGVIVGGNYEKPNETTNNLAFTTDAGKTWTLGSGLNGYRSGVAFINSKTLIAVGSNGSDISTDNGKNWKNLDKENYNAVQAKGKNAVWAVGAKGLVAKFTSQNRLR
jgi:photosystem II stability/assembly factor-like uncharacterized protein